METAERLGAILRTLQITKIEYSLNGGGDSGETTLERVTYRNDPLAHDLPDIPIFIGDRGEIRHLSELLENLVADAPEGDWVNNEGGYGTVYVRPFEDEEDLTIDCDMSYREDGDYGDDGDDQFVDDELVDDEAMPPLPSRFRFWSGRLRHEQPILVPPEDYRQQPACRCLSLDQGTSGSTHRLCNHRGSLRGQDDGPCHRRAY